MTRREPRICIYQRFLPPDPSGAGKQAVGLARNLRDLGAQVVLLGDRPMEDPPGQLSGTPVRWIEGIPERAGYAKLLGYWARLSSALVGLRNDFDILHIHSAAFHQAGAIPLARALGKRLLVRSSIQGEFAGLNRSRSGRLHRLSLRSVDQFVVLSQRIAEEYRAMGLPPSRLNLIPNGVDQERYHPVPSSVRQELRRELGLPTGGRIAVFHGVFMARKSLPWLVDVIGPALERYDLTLLLVGGPARDEPRTGHAASLRRKVEQAPFCDRIVVRGFRKDIHRYLQASDLYVLPSTSEGLPNALLEAMAVGLVPIASRTSGTEDVISHGTSGFLFEPRNADQLLEALESCLGDGADRVMARVSAAACAQTRAAFGLPSVTRRYLDLYHQMMN